MARLRTAGSIAVAVPATGTGSTITAIATTLAVVVAAVMVAVATALVVAAGIKLPLPFCAGSHTACRDAAGARCGLHVCRLHACLVINVVAGGSG